MICLILNDTNVEKDIETEFRLLVLLKKLLILSSMPFTRGLEPYSRSFKMKSFSFSCIEMSLFIWLL